MQPYFYRLYFLYCPPLLLSYLLYLCIIRVNDTIKRIKTNKTAPLFHVQQFCFVCTVVVIFMLGIPSTFAHENEYNEYEVKAAFLYHFISFVDWPEAAFPDETTPFALGILGEDPFGEALDAVFKDKKAHNHPIVVKRTNKAEDLKSCHMVFICASEENRCKDILDTLGSNNILTIAEWKSFTKQGGIIRFLIKKNKIVIKINNHNARKSNLKISSQLLNLTHAADEENESDE